MDIGLVIRKQMKAHDPTSKSLPTFEYFNGGEWGHKANAMLFVSEAAFMDLEAYCGPEAEVCIRLLGGKEIPVSRSEMFYPSHPSLQ
jgi:hypothetical protein